MSTLLSGCGESTITPGLGASLAGYFEERRATAVHDDLKARAMVFGEGPEAVALICCDLICMPFDLTQAVRGEVNRLTGIAPERVLVCATHTHTAPQPRSHLLKPDDEVTRAWLAGVPARIAQAVACAVATKEPCSLAAGSVLEDRVAWNRRYRMKDGSVRSNPGYRHPDIVAPAGPIDPEVGVLSFTRADGSIKALFVNYACHQDCVGGTQISADFTGYLVCRLQERVKGHPFVLFANGACGDINHCDFRSPISRKGHEHARWLGETLAGDVCTALARLEPLPGAALAVASERAELPLREGADPAWSSVDIQALRVGDVGIVGIPAEYFVELQLEIRARSPLKPTFVAELANGWVGYVPTRKAFAENMQHVSAEPMKGFDHMGYEVRSALSRGFLPGVGEAMAEAALRALAAVASTSTPPDMPPGE